METNKVRLETEGSFTFGFRKEKKHLQYSEHMM